MSLSDHSINRIDSIYLPSGTRWLDRAQHQARAATLRRTLDGRIHEYSTAVSVGRPITLDITAPYSWLYLAKYTALQVLAVAEGAQYSFNWQAPNNGATETYTVIFDWSEGPALDMTHRDSRPIAIDYGLYEGQIHLITVA